MKTKILAILLIAALATAQDTVTATKIDDTTAEIVIQKEAPKPETRRYRLEFLVQQRDAIEAQKQAQIEAADKEIARIDELISKAKAAGVKTADEISAARAEAVKIEADTK